jgi:hypothetical protein
MTMIHHTSQHAQKYSLKAIRYITMLMLLCLMSITTFAQETHPTLEDWWEGRAEWVMDIEDVGLPIGESDTLPISTRDNQTEYWSYLHASDQSAGIVDQCGQPVEFPGCLTLWRSTDDGTSFTLSAPLCLLPCETCPCDDERDHITAQQYPRVTRADDGTFYMAYEWHAQTMLRTSDDGITWTDWVRMTTPAGTWPPAHHPCSDIERIGEHPHIRGQADGCLVGAPPGIYIEGDMLYVFVSAGSAPAHMRCYKGSRHEALDNLQICDTDPLFGGAREYGDLDLSGADANAYFDFRYVSSADILKVGDYYYMAYEGIRGPDVLERGMDTQFGLGFARARSLDSTWEKYPNNPIIMDMTFNWGIGHADLLVMNGITTMYSATSQETRGRYKLVWRDEVESR